MNGDDVYLELELVIQTEKSMVKLLMKIDR